MNERLYAPTNTNPPDRGSTKGARTKSIKMTAP